MGVFTFMFGGFFIPSQKKDKYAKIKQVEKSVFSYIRKIYNQSNTPLVGIFTYCFINICVNVSHTILYQIEKSIFSYIRKQHGYNLHSLPVYCILYIKINNIIIIQILIKYFDTFL